MNIIDGDISNPIYMLDEYVGDSNVKINVIMIHNVESIAVKELGRLNFLFRVTDKSYMYANIVILLLWNTQSRPFTDEERRLYGVVDDVETEPNEVGSSISLRSFLAAEWSKSGPDMSGRALSGRITRSAFSAIEDLNPIAMDLSCSAIRDEIATQKRAYEETCTMMNKNITIPDMGTCCFFLTSICLVLLLEYLRYYPSQDGPKKVDVISNAHVENDDKNISPVEPDQNSSNSADNTSPDGPKNEEKSIDATSNTHDINHDENISPVEPNQNTSNSANEILPWKVANTSNKDLIEILSG